MIELYEPYTILIKNQKYYDGPGEYVGRPSILGNPFKIGEVGSLTREDAIRRYDLWLEDQLQNNVHVQDAMIQCIHTLETERVLTLICWCAPKPCHADIIKSKLLELLQYEEHF
jgi:hypothetical protein